MRFLENAKFRFWGLKFGVQGWELTENEAVITDS